MLLHFLKNLAKSQKTVEPPRRETGTILRYSLPVYFASLLDDFSGQLQVLLLGTLSTTAQVGVFALTREVSKLSELFQRSITMPAQPLMSELFSRNSRMEFVRFYRSTTRWTLALNLPVFLIFVLLPGPVLSVFGSTFASAVVILWVLIAQRLLYVATGMCATVLDMSGHTRLKLLNSAIRLVMLTGLNLWLIPRWGALGAALAAFVTTSVVGLLRLAQVGFLFRVLPYDSGFVKTIYAAGAAWLVGLGVGRWIPPSGSALNAVVNGFVVVTVYAVAVFVLGLTEEEQVILARARCRAGSIMARFAPGRVRSKGPRQKTQKVPEPAPQLEAQIPGAGQ
jgi:O-antigen/teichoic acid export membrane protein